MSPFDENSLHRRTPDRRQVLAGAGAVAASLAVGGKAVAQGKVAAPNIITPGKLVMSVTPPCRRCNMSMTRAS